MTSEAIPGPGFKGLEPNPIRPVDIFMTCLKPKLDCIIFLSLKYSEFLFILKLTFHKQP